MMQVSSLLLNWNEPGRQRVSTKIGGQLAGGAARVESEASLSWLNVQKQATSSSYANNFETN